MLSTTRAASRPCASAGCRSSAGPAPVTAMPMQPRCFWSATRCVHWRAHSESRTSHCRARRTCKTPHCTIVTTCKRWWRLCLATSARWRPASRQAADVMLCGNNVAQCSAKETMNVSETFYFAQKAVLYPTPPVFDARLVPSYCAVDRHTRLIPGPARSSRQLWRRSSACFASPTRMATVCHANE